MSSWPLSRNMYSLPSVPYIGIFLGCCLDDSTGMFDANFSIFTIGLLHLKVPGTAIYKFETVSNLGATFRSSIKSTFSY
jgi:hypothetical protein